MYRRLLDLNFSDIKLMTKEEKLLSIKAAEGRTIVSEIISIAPPLLWDISNAELACAFGADVLLLNFYDVDEPNIMGISNKVDHEVIRELKRLTGRLVGINLEPVDITSEVIDERIQLPKGRLATIENVRNAISQGIDMIVLTGNPKTGVTNDQITKAIKGIKDAVGDDIIIAAGKMHSAGIPDEIGNNIINKEVVEFYIEAGSDIILLPAPFTIPGMTVEHIKDLIDFIHQNRKLAMTSIGTSQEGSDETTIRTIALNSKMVGADIHHIGDSGLSPGMAIPENIMTYSIAIKGKRHTYRRMARSVNR